MTRARSLEPTLLVLVLVAQAALLARPLHSAVNYDEAVYLAALDALRHGQPLGSDVFAAQFPGFYDLVRGLSFVTGIARTRARRSHRRDAPRHGRRLARRPALRRAVGGLLVGRGSRDRAAARPVGSQVIADTPALALMMLSLGLATLAAPAPRSRAGTVLASSSRSS